MVLADRAEVYWNIHRKVYSVRVKGRVRWHSKRLLVLNAEFRVGLKGQARVIVEKRKNVHAVIRGEVHHPPDCFRMEHGTQLRYDPYDVDAGGFVPAWHPFPGSIPVVRAGAVFLAVQMGRPYILARNVQSMKSWDQEARAVELRAAVAGLKRHLDTHLEQPVKA